MTKRRLTDPEDLNDDDRTQTQKRMRHELKPTLDSLPIECLCMIVSNLVDFDDWKAVRILNRTFKDIASDYRIRKIIARNRVMKKWPDFHPLVVYIYIV